MPPNQTCPNCNKELFKYIPRDLLEFHLSGKCKEIRWELNKRWWWSFILWQAAKLEYVQIKSCANISYLRHYSTLGICSPNVTHGGKRRKFAATVEVRDLPLTLKELFVAVKTDLSPSKFLVLPVIPTHDCQLTQNHMLNLIHVDPPSAESLTTKSEKCAGHWVNVIINGRCDCGQ